MKYYDKLIFEVSREGRMGYSLPEMDIKGERIEDLIPERYLKKEEIKLPEVSENNVIRHYTALSNKNYGVDTGFYPLGSCTMKYNPKINERVVGMRSMTELHPYQSQETTQGALEMMYDLSEKLADISGMDYVSLQPAAGAQGEMVGLMLIKAYHEKREDHKRRYIIVPDSAHGTNPSSAQVVGFEIIEVKSTPEGDVDIEELRGYLNDELAGLMLTNPSTLGLFESNIVEIADLIHGAGGLLYYDGANMNAIMGKAKPGDMGFDVMHYNLHKTFSTPHGGGGPGAGPVGLKKHLMPFVPVPVIEKREKNYVLSYDVPDTIGKVRSFYGNYGILLRAYTYLCTMGSEGLERVSEVAVLNANYMRSRLSRYFKIGVDRICKHEFVLTSPTHGEVTTLDIAKRIIDYGYHPPTIYFPMIVEGAIMIEPTEVESKETMDGFIEAMIRIGEEMKESPETVAGAPVNTSIQRVDEAKAAREIVIKHQW